MRIGPPKKNSLRIQLGKYTEKDTIREAEKEKKS